MAKAHGETDRMRLLYFNNDLPADDLVDLLRRLENHSKHRRHPILARFLEEAVYVLRDEIELLAPDLRNTIPSFDSVQALARDNKLRRGVLGGAINGVLLLLVQLSSLIGYCEVSSTATATLLLADSMLAGLGIGMLASAAIASSTGLERLPTVGGYVVRIAFRLGVHVARKSRTIEGVDEAGNWDSWAYVVKGLTPERAQHELDDVYCQWQTVPSVAKIFISAESSSSVTLSGPPSQLQRLFQTAAFFRDSEAAPLPVFGGLCHAPHVYTSQDAADVLGDSSFTQCSPPYASILAPSVGTAFDASTGRSLFQQIVLELLTRPIVWDNIIAEVTKQVQIQGRNTLELLEFRHSQPTKELSTSLSRDGLKSNAVDLLPWIFESSSDGTQPRSPRSSKIAICGVSCRLPSAKDPDEFWSILQRGDDTHRIIPADRFNVDSHYDAEGRNVNASFTPYGCFLDDPGYFDAPFFNMSPRESEQTDPAQRLALVTAYEALEHAGFVRNRTAASNMHRVGTWYGTASDDYREVNTAQDIDTYFIPGGCRAFGPGRINFVLKFCGPSYSCDTACSSSLAAIQQACTALWSGEVDTAIAGGTNVLTNSDAFAGLSRGHFLSFGPNACKTWDAGADGYCRGEGVVSIVMRRLEDALSDNDRILGVISGAATNHSAESVSITHPDAGAQSLLYRKVLDQAGIDPFQVSYIEAHGTGTQAGDLQEVTSITNIFAPLTGGRSRPVAQPLYLGAVKSNVGHGESVAGVTSLLKVLLMLQKAAIPPHVGIKTTINPKLPKDLGQRHVHIARSPTQWGRFPDGGKRISLVNSFSAAGGNTALLVEEAPLQVSDKLDPRLAHTITLSAKSKTSLQMNIRRLHAYLEFHSDVPIADVAYTTTARRQHYNWRIALFASSIPELQMQLSKSLEHTDLQQPLPRDSTPSIAFTFTGQASADPSSNLQMFHHSPVFRTEILNLDSIAMQLGFPSFLPAIDGSHSSQCDHGPITTQLSLVCTEIALARYWSSLGVEPDLVIGHSLGEYAALCVAGVMSSADAIFLVGTRAQLLERRCEPGKSMMLAVRAPVCDLEQLLTGIPYEIACVNSPQATVLAGSTDDVNTARARLKDAGISCTPLRATYAFHSKEMDPILDDYERIASETVIFHEPRIPVLSPLLGKVICDSKTVDGTYLRRSTREPCNYLAAVSSALSLSMCDKDTFWIEIGPHPVTVEFVKAIVDSSSLAVPSFRRGEDNWTTMAQSLALLHTSGVELNWNEFHRPFEKALHLLDLPTYSWTEKNYWIPYQGDWLLTKGNDFYATKSKLGSKQVSPFKTSLVQAIIQEDINSAGGTVTMESDVMQPDFLKAALSHSMNGCGVATSSIHADVAFTLGVYLAKKLGVDVQATHLDVTAMEVTKGLVANTDTTQPQLIRVAANTEDIEKGIHLAWHTTSQDGSTADVFATAKVMMTDPSAKLELWSSMAHLIESRIDALDALAREGSASRFSRNMAYTLFASNLVSYADRYRGMQSVTMHDYEGYAHVRLTTDVSGNWTVPPYFIDSVAHLAGFIMNCSDASDTAESFCITPGWRSMYFAEKLEPGACYRSYVKMIPTREDPSTYLGDVYVLEQSRIIGVVYGIRFRRYPRILLNRFFKASPGTTTSTLQQEPLKANVKTLAMRTLAHDSDYQDPASSIASSASSTSISDKHSTQVSGAPTPDTSLSSSRDTSDGEEPIDARVDDIVARQIGVDRSELCDNTSLADIGVDSLMGLVIAEKLRSQLGVEVPGSLFLDYPTIGAIRSWIRTCYS